MTVNMELVNQVLNWIEQNENRWRQESFVDPSYKNGKEDICNSSYCFAGTTLFISGRVGLNDEGSIVPLDENGDSNRYVSWEDEAAKLLGFNEEQSWSVFYTMSHDFPKFKEHVLYIAEHPDDIDGMEQSKVRCLGLEDEDDDID